MSDPPGTQADVDPLTVFDPTRREPDIEAAKRVCQRCPGTAPCLRWALDLGQVAGIWGGTTEEERRALRRAPVPR